MNKIDLPGGGAAFHPGSKEESAEMQRVVNARHAFSLAYCRSKGWPEIPEKLSFEKILEIRAQEGWKNP
jgi:hypothetical protein